MKDISTMIDDVKFNYRVGLIIECGNEILIEVNPDIDFVTIPGGRVKTMETSKDGLKREIFEELHYKIKDKECKLRGVIENFFVYDNKNYHELYFVYKLKISKDHKLYKDNLVNEDSENNYFKWVKKSNLNKARLLPDVLVKLANDDGFDTYVVLK